MASACARKVSLASVASLAALAAATLALGSAPARAQTASEADWAASYVPASVASYFSSGNDVVVVGAGPRTASRDAAVKALQAALRESRAAKLVMDASALGAVDDLDDGAIVKRCVSLPVGRIAILRVFPGAQPTDRPQAVVLIYDKEGTSVAALSSTAGVPLELEGGTFPVGAGVDRRAAASVANVTEALKTAADRAHHEYEERYVFFHDKLEISIGERNWEPVLGRSEKPLIAQSFYGAVERPDLATRYSLRVGVKYLLVIGGVAAAVGSLISTDTRLMVGGTIVGATALMVGIAMRPDPIDEGEARALADQHNQRLKTRLGLTASRGLGLNLSGSFR